MKITHTIVAAVLAALLLGACGTAPMEEIPEPPAAGDPDLLASIDERYVP